MPTRSIGALIRLSEAVDNAKTLHEICEAALDGVREALSIERAAMLLFDGDGVLRFNAWRGLSPEYRAEMEGQTRWAPGAPPADPIVVGDVDREPSLRPFVQAFKRETIGALAFVPLVSERRIIGECILYGETSHTFSEFELKTALAIGCLVGFAVERTRTLERAVRDHQRMLYALDAASMGTWEWDLATGAVQWSDNLERIHGLAPGTFTGHFSSYEHEIHPEDRDRVLASLSAALETGAPHDVEYRIVTPDGPKWVHGKGRVEYDAAGSAIRVTGVCMDISGRKAVELENTRLFQEAQHANRLKDEFLATLSHELRTPLNVILGRTAMLRAAAADSQAIPQIAESIQRNGEILSRLVADLLDVSRITVGQMTLDVQPLSFASVLHAAAQAVQSAAQAKAIQMTVTIEPDVRPVLGDATRLQQVCWNLLANAVKFTPSGGQVHARLTQDAAEMRLTVEDSGEGIDAGLLPHVFEMFRQGEPGAAGRQSGLGLGLSIVRRLTELHGGTVTAESAGRGRGSTFTVRLPYAGAAAGTRTIVAQQDTKHA